MAEFIQMPKLGFDMAEGTLLRWLKSEGETVQKGDVIAEIETDKATVEVDSAFSGVVHQLLVEQGAVVPVGTPIAVIAGEGEVVEDQVEQASWKKSPIQDKTHFEEQKEPKSSLDTERSQHAGGESNAAIKASPLAKRMARENQLDLAELKGTGPGGRVVRKDIEEAIRRGGMPPVRGKPAEAPLAPAGGSGTPSLPKTGDVHLTMNRLRSAIGRRMVDAKQQVPHFYVTHEYDMEAVSALRRQINSLLPEAEKISINDFIIKAVALSLRDFRNLNASLSGDEIIQHGGIHIGVAVAVEGGLLTVVVRDADLKPLRAISSEVKEMTARARQGKVRPEDIEGSTFSISNLGMFDVARFIAIINPPEAAILAVGSVRAAPVVVDGEIRPGQRMEATLSADHRVTDGAEAARFLQSLSRYLEEPVLLLL